MEDALEVARALGNPVVIGHSMGGLLAQKMAEAGAVRAAVLLCAAPPRGILVTSPSLIGRQLKHMPAMLGSRPLTASRGDCDWLMFNRTPTPTPMRPSRAWCPRAAPRDARCRSG